MDTTPSPREDEVRSTPFGLVHELFMIYRHIQAGSEAELSELISAMLATAERITSVTTEARGGGAEGEGEHDPCHQLSNDVYMETMKSLQFGQPLSLICLLDCLHVLCCCLHICCCLQILISSLKRMRRADFIFSFHSTTRVVSSPAQLLCMVLPEPGGWPRRCLLWLPPSLSPPPPPSL